MHMNLFFSSLFAPGCGFKLQCYAGLVIALKNIEEKQRQNHPYHHFVCAQLQWHRNNGNFCQHYSVPQRRVTDPMGYCYTPHQPAAYYF